MNISGHPQGRGNPQSDPAADRYVSRLPGKQQAELREMASTLTRTKSPATVDGRWKAFIHAVSEQGDPVDVNALVHWVIRQSYLQNNESLLTFSDKVKGLNKQKKNIRNHMRGRGGFGTGLRGPGAPAGRSKSPAVDPGTYARWGDALRAAAEGAVRGKRG